MDNTILYYLYMMVIKKSLLSRSVSLQLIQAVIHHYQPACIFLLFCDENEKFNMHDLNKLIKIKKSLDIPFVILDIHTFHNIDRDVSTKEDRPLYVILTNDNNTRDSLRGIPTSLAVVNPKWLLFLDKDQNINDFMYNIYIQFNNEFLIAQPFENDTSRYKLTEVYYVHPTAPLIQKMYGTWSSEEKHMWPKLELYERRNSLDGITIKATVIHNLPITSVSRNGDEIKLTGGYFGSVWKVIEKQLNFTTKYFAPEQQPASLSENGTFYGMFNMVVQNKVDVGIDSFQMTSSTHHLVDFSVPLMFTRIRVFIQDSGDTVIKWDDYTRSFRPELWATIIFAVLFIGTYSAIMYQFVYYCGNEQNENHLVYSVPYSMFSTFAAFCSQGQNITPRCLSCRTVFLTSYLTAYIITAAYSGSIISYLTIKYPKLPFTNLEGLLQDTSYKIGILANSAINNMITMTGNPTLQEVHEKLIKPYMNTMPETVQEGLERVCGPEKFAFMIEYDIAVALMDKITCKPLILPDTSIISSNSMIFKEDGPYREVVNYWLYKLRAGGILRRHLLEWSSGVSNPSLPEMEVGLTDIIPIFSLLAAALILSLLILTFEICTFKKENNYEDYEYQLRVAIFNDK